MHTIKPISIRPWRALAATLGTCLVFASCGERGEPRDRAQEATAGNPSVVTAPPSDTAALAVARRALGGEVRMAIPFRIPNRSAQFVAAALPVMEWVPDLGRSGNSVAPGGHELVIVEATPESHAVHKPGLYASREPWLPRLDDTATAAPADSATLARSMGVEDADGDGTPEAWAAQYRASRGGGHTWDLRAYDRNSRTMYQVTATYGGAGGAEGVRYEFSDSARENPRARQWLEGKVRQLEAARPGASAGAAR